MRTLARSGHWRVAASLAVVLLFSGAARAKDRDDDKRHGGGNDDKPSRYVVDPFWPKQLPNNWLMGQVGGLTVDKHGNIWVNQRPRSLTDDEIGAVPNPPTRTVPRSNCCVPAPSVMEFDQAGNLLQAWGGPADPNQTHCVAPDCKWPDSEHGIFVDDDDNVWVAGNGANDREVLKFTSYGRFLMKIGDKTDTTLPPDSTSTTLLGSPADINVDVKHNVVYIADGYRNHRVAKFNATTGAFIKAWGAYGNPPVDPATNAVADPNNPYFQNPVHCVVLSKDNELYVCDRVNNRIQVFDTDGNYKRQYVFDPDTLGNGAIWDIALSVDKKQEFIFYADGENNYVNIINRKNGDLLGTFGHNGRNAGYFHWVHQMSIDSDGNIYTGEVDTSKRIQKFVPLKRFGN